MSDLLTTLHPINDNNTDLYPNVKRDNLPQNVKDELDAIPGKVDKEQGKGLSTNDFTNADKALVNTIPDKVDKVTGKGLSTNDYTNADKVLVDTIPDKVNKEQGKGLSTNDFTNADKLALETTIPEQLQLTKENVINLETVVSGKVDKVSGKGLSTNDYTNADKLLVGSIPDKVDKVVGKGLSTNDFTNADKAYLDNLPNYFISLATGGVVNVADADMPANSNTPYFGAKHGTTSAFTLAEGNSIIKVSSPQFSTWASIAVNGAGGVNLVSNRDGVSSAILSANNYKVIADHLDNGNHYKHIFEVNADNGMTFTQVTPDKTTPINLRFSQFDTPDSNSYLITSDDGVYFDTESDNFEYIYSGTLATPPEIHAEGEAIRNGRCLHIHMEVNNESSDDVTMESVFRVKFPVNYIEQFRCKGSGFITVTKAPIVTLTNEIPTRVIDTIDVSVVYEVQDNEPWINFTLMQGFDGLSCLCIDCTLFLEE